MERPVEMLEGKGLEVLKDGIDESPGAKTFAAGVVLGAAVTLAGFLAGIYAANGNQVDRQDEQE